MDPPLVPDTTVFSYCGAGVVMGLCSFRCKVDRCQPSSQNMCAQGFHQLCHLLNSPALYLAQTLVNICTISLFRMNFSVHNFNICTTNFSLSQLAALTCCFDQFSLCFADSSQFSVAANQTSRFAQLQFLSSDSRRKFKHFSMNLKMSPTSQTTHLD